jgi:hypothetical protein
MKNTLPYLLLGMLTLSLSSFHERPTKSLENRRVMTKYCYHYSLYEGKWSRSRTQSEKVFFITDIIEYNCEYVGDCDDAKRRIRNNFINQLSGYDVTNPPVTPEYFTERSQAERYRNDRIQMYQNYSRRVVEI